MMRFSLLFLSILLHAMSADAQSRWADPSPHRVAMIAVEPAVRLETLDWGGEGEPILFLAGLGNTAHSYDDFAPRFRAGYRAIGITRRGSGASTRAEHGYDADTRARDILAVLDSFGLQRVVLVGHSIAGDELSHFALQYPERVHALVYLDAYSYGEDAPERWMRDTPIPPQASLPMTAADSASVESVADYFARTYGVRLPLAEVSAQHAFDSTGRLIRLWPGKEALVQDGTVRAEYARIAAPALALVANMTSAVQLFPAYESFDAENRRMADAFVASGRRWQQDQMDRFGREMRQGVVVLMDGAHHYVHYSHADEVEKAMRDFLSRMNVAPHGRESVLHEMSSAGNAAATAR